MDGDESSRRAFTSALVKALDDARAAAAQQRPSAAAAWRKLQYDYPLLSAGEVDELSFALRGGGAAALRELPLTEPLARAAAEGAARAAAPDQLPLRRAYQRLAAQLFAATPLLLLREGEAAAAALLQRLHLPPEEAEAEASEESAAAAERGEAGEEAAEREAGGGSDSDDWQPLHAAPAREPPPPPPPPPPAPVPAKLRWLAERLRFECVDLGGLWREAGLTGARPAPRARAHAPQPRCWSCCAQRPRWATSPSRCVQPSPPPSPAAGRRTRPPPRRRTSSCRPCWPRWTAA